MRRTRAAGWTVALVLVTTSGLAACSREEGGRSVETISAAQGLQQAEDLVVRIAGAVSPGASVEDSTTKAGPDPCRSPHEGEVYYTIFKKFPAPDDGDGVTAKAAVQSALTDAGFTVEDAGDTGGWATLTGSTSLVGVRVLMSPDTPEVRVVVDSRCGTP